MLHIAILTTLLLVNAHAHSIGELKIDFYYYNIIIILLANYSETIIDELKNRKETEK